MEAFVHEILVIIGPYFGLKMLAKNRRS